MLSSAGGLTARPAVAARAEGALAAPHASATAAAPARPCRPAFLCPLPERERFEGWGEAARDFAEAPGAAPAGRLKGDRPRLRAACGDGLLAALGGRPRRAPAERERVRAAFFFALLAEGIL